MLEAALPAAGTSTRPAFATLRRGKHACHCSNRLAPQPALTIQRFNASTSAKPFVSIRGQLPKNKPSPESFRGWVELIKQNEPGSPIVNGSRGGQHACAWGSRIAYTRSSHWLEKH